MEKENKIFIAILLGSVIIGGFLYLAMLRTSALVQNSSLLAGTGSHTDSFKDKPQLSRLSQCRASENAMVTKVIDGDTVVVQGGSHVRLLGIDADEKGYPCYEPAKNRLEELVLNKQVRLQKDITDVDQYNRCLRTIFLENQNIDLELVKEGLAVARFYEPDVRYRDEIATAEKQAMEQGVGCKWSDTKSHSKN